MWRLEFDVRARASSLTRDISIQASAESLSFLVWDKPPNRRDCYARKLAHGAEEGQPTPEVGEPSPTQAVGQSVCHPAQTTKQFRFQNGHIVAVASRGRQEGGEVGAKEPPARGLRRRPPTAPTAGLSWTARAWPRRPGGAVPGHPNWAEEVRGNRMALRSRERRGTASGTAAPSLPHGHKHLQISITLRT